MQRLHWKERLLDTIQHRIHEVPVPIAQINFHEDVNFFPVRARGVFLHEHSFYLLAINANGEGGYDLLTPLKLEAGSYVLVNRGWIPYRLKPQKEEELSSKGITLPTGLLDLDGVLRLPEHYWIQSDNSLATNDWYWVDLKAMALQAGIDQFFPYILDLKSSHQEDVYPKVEPLNIDIPNNHLGYALIWFSLALALFVIYVLSSCRKDAED